MAARLESVSKPSGAAGEAGEAAMPRPASPGNKGKAPSSTPGGADAFLVYAKRDQPIVRPRRRGAINVETVIGADDRIRVDDTDKYPWRMIACLELWPKPPIPGPYIGTGWFVGPKTLITAGHCVYDPASFGGWIEQIRVIPGRRGAAEPFTSVRTSKVSAIKEWVEQGKPEFDIACVHIDKDLGSQVGWFEVASLSDDDLKTRMVNISGYPVDRDQGNFQYFHANRVLGVDPRRIYYDVDTYGGQSGSAVYVMNAPGDVPKAIAIHAYGTGGTPANMNLTANSGTRLIPELVDQIKRWIDDDGGLPSA